MKYVEKINSRELEVRTREMRKSCKLVQSNTGDRENGNKQRCPNNLKKV